MRNLTPWKIKLRFWQKEAFDKVKILFNNGTKDFLSVATPGSGKTVFAVRTAHHLLEQGSIERVIVVCPTEHLKKQWAASAFNCGINLDPAFENSSIRETSDYHGAVLTYSQVGRSPLVHGNNCAAKKTFVIFDEIHHLGDNLSWGDSGRIAFEKASFRLAISGTPFRRDNNPIPYVKYKNHQSIADYTYGYTDALLDNVCRPIYFPAYDGIMEWRIKDKVFKCSFNDILDEEKSSARLRTALDTDGKWLKMVLNDAEGRLQQIRSSGHSDAGGLIIAIDQSHARRIAALINDISGEKSVVVVSDDPNASKKIRTFAESSKKWLVSVKMVSEGVDIPRLRVGVYATNVKSELFFRQAVGRFVRIQNGMKKQESYLFIPKDIILMDYARQIERERDHYLKINASDDDPREIDRRKRMEAEEESFEAIYSVVTDKVQLEFDYGPLFSQNSTGNRLEDRKAQKTQIKKVEKEIPVFEIISNLKEDINSLSKLVASKKGIINGRVDWNYAHKQWLKIGGKPIEKETLEELQKRKVWLKKQLTG